MDIQLQSIHSHEWAYARRPKGDSDHQFRWSRTIPKITKYPCAICDKNVNLDSILCENSDCNKWIHRKCAGFSKKELAELDDSLTVYFCQKL